MNRKTHLHPLQSCFSYYLHFLEKHQFKDRAIFNIHSILHSSTFLSITALPHPHSPLCAPILRLLASKQNGFRDRPVPQAKVGQARVVAEPKKPKHRAKEVTRKAYFCPVLRQSPFFWHRGKEVTRRAYFATVPSATTKRLPFISRCYTRFFLTLPCPQT